MSRLRMLAAIAGASGLVLLGCGSGSQPPAASGTIGGGGGPAGIPSVSLSAGNGMEVVSIFGPGGQTETGEALPPFNIALASDGTAAVAQGGTTSHTNVPPLLAAALFNDMHAAGSADTLNASSTCDQSVFPDIYVKFANGPSSPDLKCATDAKSQKIMSDLIQIADYLNIFSPSPGPASTGTAAAMAIGAKR